MKKVVAIVVVLAALGAVGWRVYRKITEPQAPSRRGGVPIVPVAVEPVRRQTIRDVAEFTGTLLPRSRFDVAPKVPGRLERLLVNIGDSVADGDLIAVLDSEEYAQQVAQAQAELEVTRANRADYRSALDVATREFKRAKDLRAQQVASEADLDEAEARYRAAEAKHQVAEAQIKQKDAALKAAQVRLSYTRIHAVWEAPGAEEAATRPAEAPLPSASTRPIREGGDGRRVVAERFVDEGAMLKANDPIVSVVDTSSVIAVVHVIERDFPEIRLGQTASVATDAYEDRWFTGRIVRQAPVLREETRQARVEIEVPNPEGLLAPGMFVRARIQFAEHADATIVPSSALVRRNGEQGVFLADRKEMTARFVPVKLGITSGDAAEVLQPKVDLIPDIASRSMTISASYANASPEEIEELVTRPVEQAMSAVPGVEEVSSISSPGKATVRVTLSRETDQEGAANDIRQRLDRVLPRVPLDALVVTLGQHLLEDGARISLPEAAGVGTQPATSASGGPRRGGREARP